MGGKISKFILKEATGVIVGAWNLAILDPRWIATEILKVPAGAQLNVEMSIGPTISLRANIADLFILPASDKIIVNPSKEDKALFKLADKVMNDLYSTLPHTPISAIGYNFGYELEDGEEFVIPINFDTIRYNEVFKTFGASSGSSFTMQHSLAIHGDAHVVFNFTQKLENGKKRLYMNYHYPANNDKDRIKHSLNKFLVSYEHSQGAASRLIKREGG